MRLYLHLITQTAPVNNLMIDGCNIVPDENLAALSSFAAVITSQELAGKLGVRGLPMIIFYKKGKRVDHFTTANIDTIEEGIRDNS